MQIGTSGPRGKDMKRGTWSVRRSKVKVTEAEVRFKSLILDPLAWIEQVLYFFS